MSVRWMAEIWMNGPQETTRRFILLSLADNANDEGECYPSVAVISRKCCVKERMVQYHLQALEADGFVSITRRSAGRGIPSLYRLLKPWEKVQPIAPIEGERVQPIAPIEGERVQPIAPIEGGLWVQPIAPIEGERVQSATGKGATHCTPLIINHQEPSFKSQPSHPPTPQPGVAEHPVVEPPPSGVRAMPPPSWKLTDDQRTLVNFVLTGSPPGIVAGLTAGAVTPVHRQLVITAVKREANEHGVSYGEALEKIWGDARVQAESGVKLTLFGNIERYFNEARYRIDPKHFQENTGGNSNGKYNTARDEHATGIIERFGVVRNSGTTRGIAGSAGGQADLVGVRNLLGKPRP